MLLTDKIQRAIKFCKKAHKGQLDDYGTEYWEHPMQVARIISVVCPSDRNLICAALLHDVIEDTKWTYAQIRIRFGGDVADLVQEVTHMGQKDKIGYWFPWLKSRRGILLKFADRLSNLSRMTCWDEKRQEQYLRKSKFWKSNPDTK